MGKYECLHGIKRVAQDIAALEKECFKLKGIQACLIRKRLQNIRATLEMLMNELLQITRG